MPRSAVGELVLLEQHRAEAGAAELQRALDLRTTFGLLAYAILIHLIAGLGNIYVCEALYRAGLSPEALRRRLAASSNQRTSPSLRISR